MCLWPSPTCLLAALCNSYYLDFSECVMGVFFYIILYLLLERSGGVCLGCAISVLDSTTMSIVALMLLLLTDQSISVYSENRIGDGGLHCEDGRVACILASVS